MISENCSLEEFVERVKGKEPWEVIMLAVDEATGAERIYYRAKDKADAHLNCGMVYSRHLKRLINYFRYAVKPRRPNDKAYRLYVAHWGKPERMQVDLMPPSPRDTRIATLH